MKLFIDTANVEEIRKANDLGVICGVTTNPSLIAKEGRILVNGQKGDKNHRIKTGDIIEIELPEPEIQTVLPLNESPLVASIASAK